MKKLVLALLMLLMLCSCASNASTVEKGNVEPSQTTEDLDLGEEVILTDESDSQPTRIRIPAHDSKLASRASNAKLNNTVVKEAAEEEVLARSAEVTKGNADFNDFMDFVYDALYSSIPETANYPAVKYIVGEWTFAITAQEEMLGTAFDEVGFAEFDLNTDTGMMSLILHPRILHYEDELYSETDEDAGYLPFSGFRQENKSFLLDDNDGLMVNVRYYYEIDGHEYVRARMYVSEEAYADVLFFRDNS